MAHLQRFLLAGSYAHSLLAGSVFTIALTAACSSSSSVAMPDGGGQGDAGDGAAPSVCDAIARADLQALLPATITSVTTGIGGGSNGGIVCHVETTGIGLLVQTYPDDADKSKFDYLLGGNPSSVPFTYPITGIGDEAFYYEVTTHDGGTGVSSPNLASHKGNATCGIRIERPAGHDVEDHARRPRGLHGDRGGRRRLRRADGQGMRRRVRRRVNRGTRIRSKRRGGRR